MKILVLILVIGLIIVGDLEKKVNGFPAVKQCLILAQVSFAAVKLGEESFWRIFQIKDFLTSVAEGVQEGDRGLLQVVIFKPVQTIGDLLSQVSHVRTIPIKLPITITQITWA